MANETRSKLLLKLALVLILAGLCVVAYWRMGLRQGLDLSGGTELLYRIRIDNISGQNIDSEFKLTTFLAISRGKAIGFRSRFIRRIIPIAIQTKSVCIGYGISQNQQ